MVAVQKTACVGEKLKTFEDCEYGENTYTKGSDQLNGGLCKFGAWERKRHKRTN